MTTRFIVREKTQRQTGTLVLLMPAGGDAVEGEVAAGAQSLIRLNLPDADAAAFTVGATYLLITALTTGAAEGD